MKKDFPLVYWFSISTKLIVYQMYWTVIYQNITDRNKRIYGLFCVNHFVLVLRLKSLSKKFARIIDYFIQLLLIIFAPFLMFMLFHILKN